MAPSGQPMPLWRLREAWRGTLVAEPAPWQTVDIGTARRSSHARNGRCLSTLRAGDEQALRAAAPFARSAKARRLLRDVFGHDSLRPGQAAVVERVMAGASTLAVMPTGAGKSLCYQLPGLLLPARTVVVSPLIALMKDQCDALVALGVAASALHSGLSGGELDAAQAALRTDDGPRFVFTTPERLTDPAFLELLASQPISLLTVDEAHCVSQWGHDFRPAFLEIARARQLLGSPPVLALTATATTDVALDICRELAIPAQGLVRTGSYRPNLRYAVELTTREDEKLGRLLAYAQQTEGAGIIYAATVKAADAIHAAALEAGMQAGLYHGRLPARQRTAVQDAFMAGDLRVMVATNAFGLGIDKPDVRFVVHHQMPSGLDAYYQESGRAGRDGAPADCVLFYLHGDTSVQHFFLANRYPGLGELTAVYQQLQRAAPDGGWTSDALTAAVDGSSAKKTAVALRLLQKQHVVQRAKDGALSLRRKQLGDHGLQTLAGVYEERRAEDRAMLEGMVAYAQSGYCRWRVLLQHLAATPPDFADCSGCDNCMRAALRRQQASDEAAAEPAIAHDQAPPAAPAFDAGQCVRVKRYGIGTVVAAAIDAVTVKFANGEQRCFDPLFVKRARQPGARPAMSE